MNGAVTFWQMLVLNMRDWGKVIGIYNWRFTIGTWSFGLLDLLLPSVLLGLVLTIILLHIVHLVSPLG